MGLLFIFSYRHLSNEIRLPKGVQQWTKCEPPYYSFKGLVLLG